MTPLNSGKVLTVEAYVMPEMSCISNKHPEVVKHDFPHLQDLWFSDVCQSNNELEVDLLIGADYLWNFQKGRTKPVAVETKLGWVLSGPLKGHASEDGVTAVNLIVHNEEDRQALDSEARKLWDLESLRIRVGDEVDESFEDNNRLTRERYSVKLPWKQGHDVLPTNYANSLS